MYTVYTEIHNNGKVERWFYGRYSNRDRANEVAYDLGGEWPTYHCVCSSSDEEKFGILNCD